MTVRRKGIIVALIIPVFIILLPACVLVFLLMQNTPMYSAKVVEIGSVPTNTLEGPFTAAVLSGSDDVLVFSKWMKSRPVSTTPQFDAWAGATNMLVYSVGRNRSSKVLNVVANCSPAIHMDVNESFTPDRKHLLVEFTNASPKQIGLVEIPSGRILWKSPAHTRTDSVVCPFSNNGKQFVAEWGDKVKELWIFNTATGKPVSRLVEPPKHTYRGYKYIGFIRGSTRIRYDEWHSNRASLYIHNTISNKRTRIRRVPGGWYYPSPSRDKYITTNSSMPSLPNFYRNQDVVLRDNTGRRIRTLCTTRGREGISTFAWSPNGRYIAFNHYPDNSRWIIPRPRNNRDFVSIVDANSGRVVCKYQHRSSNIELIDWYPDSSGLICLYRELGKAVIVKVVVR